ncbi:MAG TPA: hypothetical protein PL131_12060, partial [Methylotenera sp.]|nr:hypothetical protein [Methylotenera sp.]HPH06597.1 hypothetical protein [Methylotenera sp.]HPN01841.1 hypothetical protein [Methylotenera sp.]
TYAIGLLNFELSKTQFKIESDDISLTEMRHYMPYTLQETSRSGIYILLNRNYQPPGSDRTTSIPIAKYDDFTDFHIPLTPAQLNSVKSYSHGIFGDSDAPWISSATAKAYLFRLQKLFRILKELEDNESGCDIYINLTEAPSTILDPRWSKYVI